MKDQLVVYYNWPYHLPLSLTNRRRSLGMFWPGLPIPFHSGGGISGINTVVVLGQ